MANFDLNDIPERSLAPAWRQRAIELAVEKGLVGQASFVNKHARIYTLRVTSASEPLDRIVAYDADTDIINCDCQAGLHGKPCSHAGAAYLLLKGLAPERARTPEGGAQ